MVHSSTWDIIFDLIICMNENKKRGYSNSGVDSTSQAGSLSTYTILLIRPPLRISHSGRKDL